MAITYTTDENTPTRTYTRSALTHRRPGKLTSAAVLALVSAGLTSLVGMVILSADPGDLGLDPAKFADLRAVTVFSLLLAAGYTVGAIQALRGRTNIVLAVNAIAVVVTNVLVAAAGIAPFNPLGLILPTIIILQVNSIEANAWIEARGGRPLN